MISYDTWKTASPHEDKQDCIEEVSFELTCDTDKAQDILDILEHFICNIEVISRHEFDNVSTLQVTADYRYSTSDPDSSSAWDWFYDECYKELYGISGFHNIEQK